MSDNVNEDLIEETIRRVAQGKAALKAAADQVSEREAEDAGNLTEPAAIAPGNADEHEDLIEATIRRVADDKAALKAAAEGAAVEEAESNASEAAQTATRPAAKDIDEDLIEATIRRVTGDNPAMHAASEARFAADDTGETEEREDDLSAGDAPAVIAADAYPGDDAQPEFVPQDASGVDDPEEDEDRIAATIRGVADEKAHKEAAADAGALVGATASQPQGGPRDDGEEEERIEATIRRVTAAQRQVARFDEKLEGLPAEAPPQLVPAAWAEGERILRSLDEANTLLRTIAGRLDAALPHLERLARMSVPPAAAAFEAPVLHSGETAYEDDDDDDWDESAPAIGTVNGGFAAPNILRDRPAQAAATQLPTADEVDTRPLPEPLPPLQMDSRRGLELLPRTYRITVEDKRHGVDLVPLHRALLGMEGVRDMSLLNYTSAAAIVSLETVDELQPELLERSVSRAMSRPARVEVHNEHSMVVKLAEE